MTGQRIKDEFTDLPISRQRKYLLRRQRDGRCELCGEPVRMGRRCLKHLVERRELLRKKLGCKRRYYNSLGYQLEANPRLKAGKMRRGRLCCFRFCTEPPVAGRRKCLKHLVEQRERERKQLGCKRRNRNALSYRLEAKAKAAARRKRSGKIR